MTKYKTIDLFAGIGGIRRGFELTNSFENILSAEIDKYACITYEHLFKENPYNDVTSDEFLNKVLRVKYDTLLAGFPCQSFSRAGKQEGFMDLTRGTLFFDIAKIIKLSRPKSFLLENVDNLISHDKGNTFKVILEILVNELNYKVIGVEKDILGGLIFEKNNFIRNSKNFGIPQNRPRVYLMGFDADFYSKNIEKLSNFSLPIKSMSSPIYNNLNDLLDLKADPEFYVSEGYFETLKKHRLRHENKGNGFGYMIVNSKNIANPISNAILATGGSGKERNLIYDPQESISGLVLSKKKTPLNSEGIRHMTPREWGKLQGFINFAFKDESGFDHFTFPEGMSNAQLYKQFGNSVSIPVIKEMAQFMLECLRVLENEK